MKDFDKAELETANSILADIYLDDFYSLETYEEQGTVDGIEFEFVEPEHLEVGIA